MDSELRAMLLSIEDQLAQLRTSIQTLHDTSRAPPRIRQKKEKPMPLTAEEMASSRERFLNLFNQWLAGKEIDVHDELNGFEVERLRQFADANNLNVTSKMSKARMLELIAARFREKRQLHKPPVERGAG
jgi:hypothetical protein